VGHRRGWTPRTPTFTATAIATPANQRIHLFPKQERATPHPSPRRFDMVHHGLFRGSGADRLDPRRIGRLSSRAALSSRPIAATTKVGRDILRGSCNDGANARARHSYCVGRSRIGSDSARIPRKRCADSDRRSLLLPTGWAIRSSRTSGLSVRFLSERTRRGRTRVRYRVRLK